MLFKRLNGKCQINTLSIVLFLAVLTPGLANASSVLIKGVTIVDGTGRQPYSGNILIEANRIAQIARADSIIPATSTTVLRAPGFVVCPGFIDVHSHDDLSMMEHPEQLPKLMMGVTTVIVGNCGIGIAPFDGDANAAFEGLDLQGLRSAYNIRFDTMG